MAQPNRTPLPIRFTPLASDDLEEAFAYVETHDRPAASELLDRLRSSIGRLADFPNVGVALSSENYELVTPGVRFLTVEPYIVFYRSLDSGVVVLRILHSRRDALGELLR